MGMLDGAMSGAATGSSFGPWGALAGGALGAIGGSKGSKQSAGPPKFVKKQIKLGYKGLNDAAARTPTEAIAGFNADQNNAFGMIRGNVGLGAGTIQEAIDKYRSASNGITTAGINKFMNPYTSEVIDASVGDIERSRARTMLGINAEAEAAKAFGGDREAVAKALAAEDYNRNIANTVSGLRFGGWNSAVDSAFRDNASVAAGAGGLLDAVGQQRGAAYQDAGAVLGVGDKLQAYDQSLLDYPLEMAKMQIDAGTGASGMGSTTKTGGGISGAMAGAAGGYDLFGRLFGAGTPAPKMSEYGPYSGGYRFPE